MNNILEVHNVVKAFSNHTALDDVSINVPEGCVFGLLGSIMFFVGIVSAAVLGIQKLIAVSSGEMMRLITDSPYFYLALCTMILGTQLFLTGFVAELIGRNSPTRNSYLIEQELNFTSTNENDTKHN